MGAEPSSERSSRFWFFVPWGSGFALVIAGFLSIGNYGVNWDEALGDLFFGQRYLSFFTSLDSRYLDFTRDPYPLGFEPDLTTSPFRHLPWEHYPVGSTLATATARGLSRIGIFDYFDGFHALNLILGFLFLVGMYGFVERWLDRGTALLSVLFLFLAPRMSYHFLVNVKDFPEMVFFAGALMLLFDGNERGSPLRILAGGIVFGLALGTKANALFLPVIAVLYLLLRGDPPAWNSRRRARIVLLLSASVIAVALFLGSWPYLWHDTLERLVKNLHYIALRKELTAAENSANPLLMLLLTSPPAILLALLLGTLPWYERIRRRDPLAILLVCWIGVVLARLVAPGTVNFDGVRHFLEIFPALAIVSAMGVTELARELTRRLPRVRPGVVGGLVGFLFVAPVVTSLARTYPFQVTYFNVLAGGPAGAVERGIPQSGDYWATSYRLGIAWINRNAPRDAILVVPIAEHTVRIAAAERLRPDIRLARVTRPWTPQLPDGAFESVVRASRQSPVLVMFVPRTEWFNDLVLDCRDRLAPVASWGIEGTDFLQIYLYEPPP